MKVDRVGVDVVVLFDEGHAFSFREERDGVMKPFFNSWNDCQKPENSAEFARIAQLEMARFIENERRSF